MPKPFLPKPVRRRRARRAAPRSRSAAATWPCRPGYPRSMRPRRASCRRSGEGPRSRGARSTGDRTRGRAGHGRRARCCRPPGRQGGSSVTPRRLRRRFRASFGIARSRIRFSQASNRVRLAQSRKVTPAPDERLLDGVRGAVVIPEDQPGDPVHGVDRLGDEDVVRVPIPIPRASHQLGSLHRSLASLPAARVGGRSPYWRDSSPTGSKIAPAGNLEIGTRRPVASGHGQADRSMTMRLALATTQS